MQLRSASGASCTPRTGCRRLDLRSRSQCNGDRRSCAPVAAQRRTRPRSRSPRSLQVYRSRHPKAPTTLITRAYEVAHDAHRDQRRKSGEAYITHPLAVATIVAGLGLDDVTLAAALLHDAVEDTGLTLADVERDFGSSVAELVDGVTKLERLEFDSKEQQQAASMRKMLLAMARDLRVVIIKLADRLHNMRTIAALPRLEAAAHRPRDDRHLLAAGPPPRHAGPEAAARGPGLRHAVPAPLRRDRPHGQPAGARARPLPVPGARGRAGPARGAAHPGGRDRPPEAPVEHLREDGRAGQGVRRDLRPRRHPRHRRLGQGLLRRARLDPRHVEARAGPLQGLHRAAQVQPLPVAAHHRDRSAGQDGGGADPHPGDALSEPSSGSPPTGRTRAPATTWSG